MSVQIGSQDEMNIIKKDDDLGFLSQDMDSEELEKLIEIAGYSYDSLQDIFYSTLDPWQRKVGYCRLYDEAAAPMGMIIDCEPIYFDYNDKKWMIGLWKGQYDLVTGAEIGVYIGALDLKIPGVFIGTFYSCASDTDLLQMSYTLTKNGKTLFTRQGKHWWLTGFKLGEFSEPSELVMDINITLKDVLMRDAFVVGLKNAGYADEDLIIYCNTVSFRFDIPHTPQPVTRRPSTDRLIQKKNKLLCDKYQEMTKAFDNLQDKLGALKKESPDMYQKIMNIGKAKPLAEIYDSLLSVVLVMLAVYLSYKVLNSGGE